MGDEKKLRKLISFLCNDVLIIYNHYRKNYKHNRISCTGT